MSHPVKHFHSAMTGAPALTGSAGAMLAVLDACLVTGFNLLILDSLIITDGVLTGIKAGHGFKVDQVISISGAGQTVLNGEWVVTTTTSNSFTATATGIANTVGTGTISAKSAPAGWEKSFSGTNTAAYRSLAPEATGFYLRVDDANTAYSRAVGYESMTDIDTGINPFPTTAQVAGGAYWRKSYGGATTVRDWLIIADGEAFYLVVNSSGTAATLVMFGDFQSHKAGDGYACILTGDAAVPDSNPVSAIGWSSGTTENNAKAWIARSYSQLGSAVSASTASMTGWNPGVLASGASNSILLYPSPVDNGLILVDPVLMEGSNGTINVIRGSLPGMYFTPQRSPLNHLDKVHGVSGIEDRTIMMINMYVHYSVTSRVAVDITGPWR